jgi:hypothetical protein
LKYPRRTISGDVAGRIADILGGYAVVMQRFTRRSRDRSTESAIEAPYPYGKTSNEVDRTASVSTRGGPTRQAAQGVPVMSE